MAAIDRGRVLLPYCVRFEQPLLIRVLIVMSSSRAVDAALLRGRVAGAAGRGDAADDRHADASAEANGDSASVGAIANL